MVVWNMKGSGDIGRARCLPDLWGAYGPLGSLNAPGAVAPSLDSVTGGNSSVILRSSSATRSGPTESSESGGKASRFLVTLLSNRQTLSES